MIFFAAHNDKRQYVAEAADQALIGVSIFRIEGMRCLCGAREND